MKPASYKIIRTFLKMEHVYDNETYKSIWDGYEDRTRRNADKRIEALGILKAIIEVENQHGQRTLFKLFREGEDAWYKEVSVFAVLSNSAESLAYYIPGGDTFVISPIYRNARHSLEYVSSETVKTKINKLKKSL